MHDASDRLITLAPRSAACRIARASVRMSPALRRPWASSGVGRAGLNATEDCLMEISDASGATPTMPSGAPSAGPGISGCLPSAGPDAGASGGGGAPSSGGGGGGGGGAVTVTVDGGGVVGGALVGAGFAGGGGGGAGAPPPPARGPGLAPGLDGAPAMIDATTVPWLSQSVSPPLGSPCT